MDKFCKYFRLSHRNELFLLILLGAIFYTQCRVIYFPFDQVASVKRATLHVDVMAGQAPAPLQYQMYVPGLLLEAIVRLMPDRTALTFSRVYSHFYVAIFIVGLLFLYRLCRRVASAAGSALACFFVAGIFPVFWYDSYYHPSDPIGFLITIGLMETLLDEETGGWRYYFLLVLSGFFWEKNSLLPFSVGLYQYFKGMKKSRILEVLLISLAAAAFGQIFLRVLFDTDRHFLKSSLVDNLAAFSPVSLVSFPLVYGPAVLSWLMLKPRSPLLTSLILQWPVWFVIYILFGESIFASEMRCFIVMVPYTFPLLAIGFDALIERLRTPSLASRR